MTYEGRDVVAFHLPYKRFGLEEGDELRVVGVVHETGTVSLLGESDLPVGLGANPAGSTWRRGRNLNCEVSLTWWYGYRKGGSSNGSSTGCQEATT